MKQFALVLTSAFHFFALIPLYPLYYNYFYTMLWMSLSTICSMAWHALEEPNGILAVMDYTGAVGWFLLEMWNTRQLALTFTLNMCVFFTNRIISHCHSHSSYSSYSFYHSLWHIASAIKCIVVVMTYDRVM
jgi:hypothetical protein